MFCSRARWLISTNRGTNLLNLYWWKEFQICLNCERLFPCRTHEFLALNQGVGILIALLDLVYCKEQFLRCQSHVFPSSPVTFSLQVSKTPPPWPHIWPLRIVAFGRRHPDPQPRPASIRKGPHMYGRTAMGAAQGMDLSAASQGEPDQNNLLRWRANSYDIWFQ